jgi:hypothetical protein
VSSPLCVASRNSTVADEPSTPTPMPLTADLSRGSQAAPSADASAAVATTATM